MSSSMRTILIIGGTSGIGEAFAKRWHSAGKKLVLTGRREARLKELEAELPGTRTYAFDITDLKAVPGHVKALFEKNPDIDTVWINSGKGNLYSIKDPSSFPDEAVIDEINTNITGPMIIARHTIPKLLAKSTPTNFLITSSGLGYAPNGTFPTYPPGKAFIHHYMAGIRGALKDTNVNVIEIVPPMVRTDFHQQYSEVSKGIPCMSLEDFVNDTFKQLDGNKAEDLKEVAAGSAQERVDFWRAGPGKYMEKMKIPG
ncbi:hypothetical protein M409DRAFT_53455 [Zasmidium cellare ATCC 36951]|uniref:Uncharacterized protein n=1 Tax=Zasmidium cellare ATCC 36951 TaxID=1080233 RepID=A0A6A6CNC7_ZASCE|nr:uncharacterized protein M409DRAFT_53455 [Zasmidium cellare ATCC 36951]KAF2168143.1 hypothetical protein M409DRAFT_53455 [Zasmidium cellare ATCC 36951]